ncbi:MAG TPA: hypothetical protein VHD35_04415 [Chitinophagaceae bacterium]|nr:hypothetical protein [Chitinophagaceae bacterium]
MKKASYHIFLLLLALVSLQISCRKSSIKSEPQLPPITQIGANTFGCKINGKVWVPHFACTAFGDPCGELEYTVTPQFNGSDTSLFISLVAGNDSGGHAFFQIGPRHGGSLGGSSIKGIGNYADSIGVDFYTDISDYYLYDSLYRTVLINSYYTFYVTNLNPVFNITTIDATKGIVAGTFAFTLFTQDLKDSLIITDGRFDIRFGNYCRCSQ